MKTDHRSQLSFALLLATALLVGCAGDASDAVGEDSPATAESADSVEYEPAFPEEVSSQGLTDSDAAQQEAHTHADGETHSHGEGEAHAHDGNDGEPPHDGGEDHEH